MVWVLLVGAHQVVYKLMCQPIDSDHPTITTTSGSRVPGSRLISLEHTRPIKHTYNQRRPSIFTHHNKLPIIRESVL